MKSRCPRCTLMDDTEVGAEGEDGNRKAKWNGGRGYVCVCACVCARCGVFAKVKNRFILHTTSSHVSIPRFKMAQRQKLY